jgi:uncharacterized protein YcfJ
MKRELLCGAAITFISVSLAAFNAFAENYTVQGTVVEANPVYQTVTKQVPTQTCQMVQVPVYGNGNSGNGGTLGLNNNIDIGGAIIGGVIGNNVTKNVDNGGAIGALLGGLIGSQMQNNNSQSVVGYRQEQRCATSYTQQSEQVLGYTQIVVDAGGYKVTAKTKRSVKVGDVVNVGVALTVQ